MKASNALLKLKDAAPDATVFCLVGGRYVRVDDIVLSAVDPAVQAPSSVCFQGERFYSESNIREAMEKAVSETLAEWAGR